MASVIQFILGLLDKVISASGAFLLTAPRLKNFRIGEVQITGTIIEFEDMSVNSTSGEYEISWQAANYKYKFPCVYMFAFISIENCPVIRSSEKSIAKGVSAYISCTEINTGRILKDYYARPADTPAPGSLPSYGSYEAAKVNIPPGGPPRGFYIAFRSPDEEGFYGFSNLSYEYFERNYKNFHRYYDWKNPELKMNNGNYKFKITIEGENIKPIIYTRVIGPGMKEVKLRS